MPKTILLLVILAGCVSCVPAPGTAPPPAGCAVTEEAQQAAEQFRALRSIPGHFGGGDWNVDVDTWMGPKHQRMIELGAALGTGDCLAAQAVALLGLPDETAAQGDAIFDLVGGLPGFGTPDADPVELLIYHWRGMHDFLYFSVQDDMILNAGWWYAQD